MKEIADVIDVILVEADKQREASDSYKDLFSADEVDGLLRRMEEEMMTIILNGASVLEKKFGVSFTTKNGHRGNEAFGLLLSLPLLAHKLEEKIKAEQGITCCVDKTYYLLSRTLTEFGVPKKE